MSTATKARAKAPARKTTKASPKDGEYKPLKICFERILPRDMDATRGARHAIRDLLAAQENNGTRFAKLPKQEQDHVTRMAVQLSKKWPEDTVLKCRFLDGTPKMQAKVKKMAKLWQQFENVTFKFVSTGEAQIRISFKADPGSWSAVGTDALNTSYFPKNKPTMNFGWLRDDTDDTEYRRVVVHEFGHAIGCIHEHESPTFSRVWNRKAVYKAFMGPPNNWSKAEIDSNVLDKYSPKGISATVYDPASIMLYAFPAELFSDGKGPTNENTELSPKDKQKIAQMYPK
jgi:hypothetical protein